MNHFTIDNKLLAITTFASVLFFELSAFFIDNGLGWMNQVKNVIYVFLLYLVAKDSKGHCNPIPWFVKCFALITIGLIMVQMALGMASNVSSWLLQVFMFLLFIRYSNLRFARYLMRTILVMAFLSSLPLIWYYFIYGYYAREMIIFDKSYQTFLFGASYVYLFYFLTRNNVRHKTLLLILFVYFVLCNVFILQSKTSIFSILSIIALWSFWHPKRLKTVCLNYSKYLIIVVVSLVLLPIQLEMPDGIKQAVNMFVGREVYKMNVVLKEDTYVIRRDIRKKMWAVLDDSPLLGGGIGQMETTLKSTGYGLSQGESQLVDLALEGGYTFVFAFLLLIGPYLLRAWKKARCARVQNQYEFVCLSFVCFVILCTGNEILSVVTWMYVAILNYLLHCKGDVEI